MEFDWDDANLRHLRRHRVSRQEFEQVLLNGPLDLEYRSEGGEDRFKSLGMTDNGRILVAVWAIRGAHIRAVTAYPASAVLKRVYTDFPEGTNDAET